MSSSTQLDTPSFSSTIFTKTPAGRSEVAQRTSQLSNQQRSLLIVIDGKRNYHSLQQIVPEEILVVALGALRDLKLIATRASGDDLMDEHEQGLDRPVARPFAEVKKLMVHSAEGYLGPMARPLIRQISAAYGEKEVRLAMSHWHMAMRESKFGRAEISELILRITALLYDEAQEHLLLAD